MTLFLFSEAWGKVIDEKTWSKKSRYTAPLNMPHSPPTQIRGQYHEFYSYSEKPRESQAAFKPRQGLLSPKVIYM